VKANIYLDLTEVSASTVRHQKLTAELMAIAKATMRPKTMTTTVMVADPPKAKSPQSTCILVESYFKRNLVSKTLLKTVGGTPIIFMFWGT